jgi:hypothetical protein
LTQSWKGYGGSWKIPEPTAVERIRALPADEEFWRRWLLQFPDLPPTEIWYLNRWFDRIDPYLARMPEPFLLPQESRVELRILLGEYASDLRDLQRQSDHRDTVEGSLLAGSGVAWKWGLTWLEPFSLTASALLFVRNRIEDRRWKGRKAELRSLALHIRMLSRHLSS